MPTWCGCCAFENMLPLGNANVVFECVRRCFARFCPFLDVKCAVLLNRSRVTSTCRWKSSVFPTLAHVCFSFSRPSTPRSPRFRGERKRLGPLVSISTTIDLCIFLFQELIFYSFSKGKSWPGLFVLFFLQ